MSGPAYAAVPMPPAVAKLPRVGVMPVPYITEYRVNGEDPKYPDMAAPGGLVVACRCEFGTGVPVIGKQCPPRQRKAMAQRRCNVCGQRITGEALFAGVYQTPLRLTPVDVLGPPVRVSMEAPTHPRCLAYSAIACPTLRAGAEGCRVAIVPGDYPLVDRWAVDPHGLRTEFVPHGHAPVPGQFYGALDFYFARLDAPDVRTVGLADWMTRAAPKPYRTMWRQAT